MTLNVVGAIVTFLIDTRATYSALTSFSGPTYCSSILLTVIDDSLPMAISLPSYLLPLKILCSRTPS